jgi:2-methylcitrate dehydratase PrpD
MDTQSTPNAVARIARYAAHLSYADLTDEVIARARQLIFDTIGTTLGGARTPLGVRAANFAAQMRPGHEASIIGDGRTSTVEGAAWANGTAGKFLGMDDSHRTCGHIAAELVPALLALAEANALSGERVILALTIGYDVMNAIQPAVSSWQRERGYDHKGQAGTMAAAVTAAVAMDLPEDQIAHALALAMDMACGTEQYVYDAGKCDTKDLLAGYAAANGIYAAKLAAFGFQGPPGALDGAYGYFNAFGPGYDPAYLDAIGKRFAITETAFKPHAGCRQVHSCVDATLDLMRKGAPPLDQIAAIHIGSYNKAITPSFRVNPAPETVGQAGFSLPVTVSVVLTRGGWYREDIETYDAPEAKRLRGLVTVALDEAIEAAYPRQNGCVVRITAHDGAEYIGRVDYAKGEPENMLTDAEFEAKFRRLVGDLLPDEQIETLIDLCGRMETLADVGTVVRATHPTRTSVSNSVLSPA